jgi:FkbM family methyltransferase
MLGFVIPTVRAYVRYLPMPLGKQAAMRVVTMHHYGLEPPKWDFTVSTLFGRQISANTRDMVGKFIYYFGVWEPNLTRWIERRLSPGDGFIDVGANIGYYSLLASKLVGRSGMVVSIEALPAIFELLEKNIKINHAGNVRALNCAAWDAEGMLTIYTQPEDLPAQTTVMPAWAERYGFDGRSKVPAAPLSAMLKPEEFKTARLIKIDVEGAEWHVLSGLRPLLPFCRDDLEIMVEISPVVLAAEDKTFQDLLNVLDGYGFHAYQIENRYLLETYMRREPFKPPQRVREPFSEQTDVIFSRINAESL